MVGKSKRPRRPRVHRPRESSPSSGGIIALRPINSSLRVDFKGRFQQTGNPNIEFVTYAQDISRMLVMATDASHVSSLVGSFRIKRVKLIVPNASGGASTTAELTWCAAPSGSSAVPGVGGRQVVLNSTVFGSTAAAVIDTRPPRGSFQALEMPFALSGNGCPLFKFFTGAGTNLGIIELDVEFQLTNLGYKVNTTGTFAHSSITANSAPTAGIIYIGYLDSTQNTPTPSWQCVDYPSYY